MKLIAYYRVSTKRQGQSGLGLEAQREQITRYAQANGATVIAEFTEIKSGTSRKRKELAKAVAMSKEHKAAIIVAKLDRLARDAEYAHYILNNAYEIRAVDLPAMNKMVFGFFSLMAEYERDLISQRTKDALAAKRAQGWKRVYTKPRFNVGQEACGARERWQDNKDYSYSLHRTLSDLRSQGMSLRAIADRMNKHGERTRGGSPWNAVEVSRVLKMADAYGVAVM